MLLLLLLSLACRCAEAFYPASATRTKCWHFHQTEARMMALTDTEVAQIFHRVADTEREFLGPGDVLPYSESAADAIFELCAANGAGLARLGPTLSPRTAEALRVYILKRLRDATQHTGDSRLSEVMTATAAEGMGAPSTKVRWDLRLPMSTEVVDALREMLTGHSALGETLEAAAGGREAELWELGALISSPGAVAQIVHADVQWEPRPYIHTTFVALQPISRDLGPTRFVPYTHARPDLHDAHRSHGDARALSEEPLLHWHAWIAAGRPDQTKRVPLPSQVGLLNTGDATVYDARLFHAGGANSFSAHGAVDDTGVGAAASPCDGYRILFYLTLRGAERVDYVDPTRTLLEEYRGCYTLGRLRDGISRLC